MTDGRVIASYDFTAADWVHANRAYGRLIARGHHARLVSTGLVEQTISEAFGVLADGYHPGPCPACGAVCLVGHKTDATGRRIIADHWSGEHKQCHPDGCHEGVADSPRIRTREEQ